MIFQVDAVEKLVSIPWETLTIPSVFALIIAGLIWERKRILNNHKGKDEELSERITKHMEDIKELSTMNGEISNKFEKVFQNLIVILEMLKINKNVER